MKIFKGSIPNMSNIVNLQSLTPEPKAHSFVDTIHGLTDKLHQLRHDDKSKSGKFSLNFLILYFSKKKKVSTTHTECFISVLSPMNILERKIKL